MRKKLLATLLSALALAFAFAIVALAGCQNEEPTKSGAYYLSVLTSGEWTNYKSDADIPSDKKFVKEGESYTLSVDLDEGTSVKIAQVGSDKTYGGDEIFSANTQLTKGTDNAISVGASGTYDLTLDVSAGEISYKFTPKAAEATVVEVEIDDAEDIDLPIGGKKQLSATAKLSDETTTDAGITWESADTAVATVENGLVTAVATGTTTVIAKHGTVESDPVIVNVSDEGTVILSETSLKLAVNGEVTLTYTAYGDAVAGEWVSTDDTVATVDQTGKVTALKAGTATIRLSYTPKTGANPRFADCVVTVDVPVTNITLSNSAIKVAMESSATLTVGITPANATNPNYTYAISAGGDTYITVEKDGNTLTITPKATGTATITVTSEDGNYSATCDVTVVAAGTVTSTISTSSLSLNKTGVNNAANLTVSVSGDDIVSVNWVSGNGDIATVAGVDGEVDKATVTGAAFGTTTITASITTAGGQSLTETCTVRVAPQHFFLFGALGDKQWTTDLSVLETQKMVFTDNGDGTYTLIYDLLADQNFRIGDDDGFGDATKWVSLNNTHLKSGQNIKNVSDSDHNMAATIAGTYTITIDISADKPITIVCDAIAVTSIALEADNGTLISGDATKNSAVITLTVYPNGTNKATYTQDDINWTYDDTKLTVVEGENTLTVTVIDGTAKGSITVSCEVKGKTASVNLAITEAGKEEVKPTSVKFGQTSYSQNVNGTGGWTINVSASVLPADADNDIVTYSGSAGIDVDAATGAVTASKVGTYTVTATAAGDTEVKATTTVTFYSDEIYLVVYEVVGITWNTISIPANYAFTANSDNTEFTVKAALEVTEGNAYYFQIEYKVPDNQPWNYALPKVGATLEGNGVASLNSKKDNIVVSGGTGIYTVTLNISDTTAAISVARDGDIPGFTAKLSDGSTEVTASVDSPVKNRWTIELEGVAFEADKEYTIQLLKGTDAVTTVNNVTNFGGDASANFANGTNGFTCSKAGNYNVTIECDVYGNATISVFEAKDYPYQLVIGGAVVKGITLDPETEGQSQYTISFSRLTTAWEHFDFKVSAINDSSKSFTITKAKLTDDSITFTDTEKLLNVEWSDIYLDKDSDVTLYGVIVFTVDGEGNITVTDLTVSSTEITPNN